MWNIYVQNYSSFHFKINHDINWNQSEFDAQSEEILRNKLCFQKYLKCFPAFAPQEINWVG